MRRLLLVVVLLQVAMANAFLCDVPVFGWFFRIFLPFLCGDVDGPPTPTSTMAPIPTSMDTTAPIPTSTMAPTSTAPTPTGTLPQGPTDIFVGFDFAGCFLKLVSEDSHTVTGPSINERAVECRNSCVLRTRLFGVVATECFCYTDTAPPRSRLSLGGCDRVTDGTPDEDRMELYFASALTAECNNKETKAIRDALVLQDSAQFGYDLVTNSFRDDIFEFFADECGTNIYEVQATSSGTEGSLQTSSNTVRGFATALRQERSMSWEVNASAEFKNALVSVSGSVGAAGDEETSELLETTGASTVSSKVFTSFGVRRVAAVKLEGYDNRFSFVSFNEAFGNLLIKYRDSGYSATVAKEMLDGYGQFVLTQGLYGGYMQFRCTIRQTSIESSLNSETDAEACFEASATVAGRVGPFKGEVSGAGGACSDDEAGEFKMARTDYAEETSSLEVVGGRLGADDSLEVLPGDAVLLKETDKYPGNADASGVTSVQFRLLSDFLKSSKVSPLEVRRLAITEVEFDMISETLQQHILNYFIQVQDIIGDCGCNLDAGGLPYIVGGACKCYQPGNPQFCFSEDDCINKVCSRGEGPNNDDRVCCESGETVEIKGKDYCTQQPPGTECASDAMCAEVETVPPTGPTDPSCMDGKASGGFCCEASCAQCGGEGCSPGSCCTGPLSFSAPSCSVSDAPCLISANSDPTCETGIQAGKTCCTLGCGVCGGTGCGGRPGGASECCDTGVNQQRSCNNFNPPCIVEGSDPACANGIVAGNTTCCAASCGTCGGEGCETRPGGATACCPQAILDASPSCNDHIAPCVMGVGACGRNSYNGEFICCGTRARVLLRGRPYCVD